MRVRFDFSARVGHGDCQAAVRHHRQINYVVPYECGFAGIQSSPTQYLFEHGPLVLNALINIIQLQIASAEGHGFRDPLRDQPRLDSGQASE
jgi:hypothetical protein